MNCYFQSHSDANLKDTQKIYLKRIIKKLIQKGVVNFLFHDLNKFMYECFYIVEELQKIYPNIKLIYISENKSHYPIYTKDKKEATEKFYERYCKRFDQVPHLYVDLLVTMERGYIMENNLLQPFYQAIDMCDYCIFYFLHKTIARRGGQTAYAYDYAKKHGKLIINIAYK